MSQVSEEASPGCFSLQYVSLHSLAWEEKSDHADFTGTRPRTVPGTDQLAKHTSADCMALPISDLSELSPLDMDLGPFVAGTDWDIFTHSMEQDYLGLPFQKESMPAREQYLI